MAKSGNTIASVTTLTKPDSSTMELFYEVTPRRTLDSLILSSETLRTCNSWFEERKKMNLLRSYGVEPRHKILLIGPPGNGKTSLAEAIAEALTVPLFVVRYDSIIGSYLGETAGKLSKLFEYAATRECVLFLDEFETLGKERGDPHETGEIKRVVSSLLFSIDKLPSHVVAIGATNHPEMLDRAAWRRFQICLSLPNPGSEELTEWFEKFERRIGVPLGYSAEDLGGSFGDCSFSDVEEFGAGLFRRYVMDLPNANMKNIVTAALEEKLKRDERWHIGESLDEWRRRLKA